MQSRRTDGSTALDLATAELRSLAEYLRAAELRLTTHQKRLRRASKSARVVALNPGNRSRFTLEGWLAGDLQNTLEDLRRIAELASEQASPDHALDAIRLFVEEEHETLSHRRDLEAAVDVERRRRRRVVRAQALARRLWKKSGPARGIGNPWHWHRRALLALVDRDQSYAADLAAFDAVAPTPAPEVVPPDWWETEAGWLYFRDFAATGLLNWSRETFRASSETWIAKTEEDVRRAFRAQKTEEVA